MVQADLVLTTDAVAKFNGQRLRPGTRIKVSYLATVIKKPSEDVSEGYIALQRDDKLKGTWYERLDQITIEVVPPDVVPGCVLTAGGAMWSVRKSNKVDSYRVCPVDLSGNLRTLPIEQFTAKYPAAKVIFDPRARDTGDGTFHLMSPAQTAGWGGH